MHRVLLSSLTAVLALTLGGCFPSSNAEAEEHLFQGIEYERQGMHALAMKEFNRAIELDPRYDLAYYNRALVHFRIGDLERSLADYNIALELSPNNPYWTYERGFLYLQLGDREKAIADLERSLELGLILDERQMVEDALSQLRP